MKYGELVHFDPIQSVKVLRNADSAGQAAEDLRTFVISHRMAAQLAGVVLHTLAFSPEEKRLATQVGKSTLPADLAHNSACA